MEKMNQEIPFEHQMMFIVKDYDRKVEENMELRKEVEELSAALEKQGVQLHDAKVDLKNEIKKEEEAEKALKKKPTFDEESSSEANDRFEEEKQNTVQAS